MGGGQSMTKEQEKAIKVLEQYKHECIEEYKVELDDKKYIDEQHASYLHQQIEAVHIVLSMLKENSAEIQQKNTELAEKNAETEKKDKIIELMATTLSAICTGLSTVRVQFEKEYCEFINSDKDCCWKRDTSCKDCIKQYFERKSRK